MRKLIFGVAVALAACAQHHQMTKVDDSGLARLDERQMQPVDLDVVAFVLPTTTLKVGAPLLGDDVEVS